MMPLKVSDGIGAWIDDFKKSDAPQFKGHSKEKRRDQAIAAYLSAKRGKQNESVHEDIKYPHKMYDPKTGKEVIAKTPDELDEKIKEMINVDKPVIFDCVVDKAENCFPMIPSGKPHNEMILGPDEEEEISDEGKILV